ncbi:hypothetical protein RIF29_19826 [Crotalaria pallida]|uniref:Protein FAR1-RELATED SEQUENCE n=1 Tax=Crotalaria pallida TaxID=3830 RepID=A0AAN9F0K2_CROPI
MGDVGEDVHDNEFADSIKMVDESFIETEVDEDDVHSDEFTEEDEEFECDKVDDFVEEDEGVEEDVGDEEHEHFEGRRRIIVDDDADIRAFRYDELTLDVIKRIDFKDVETKIRGVTAKVVKVPNFVEGFNSCMFNDYEVNVFERRWHELVESCGLDMNSGWIKEANEKKKMWVTAYLKGSFFARLRNTSRCEGLHSKFGRYVGSRNSLYEFLQHYHRCLDYISHNEHQKDYNSWYEMPVLITHLPKLERSGALVYSHDWLVSVFSDKLNLKCSCLGMESFGLPCPHIVAVLVHIDVEELPSSLVLNRWCKTAKEGFSGRVGKGAGNQSDTNVFRHLSLVSSCIRMCRLACGSMERYNEIKEKVLLETKDLMTHFESTEAPGDEEAEINGIFGGGGDEFNEETDEGRGLRMLTSMRIWVRNKGKRTCTDKIVVFVTVVGFKI